MWWSVYGCACVSVCGECVCGVCGRWDVCLYGFVCTGVANVCVCVCLSVYTLIMSLHLFSNMLHRSMHILVLCILDWT